MSSLPSEDTSCMKASSHMSCDAMSQLAMAEVKKNNGVLSYMIEHPACQRFQELSDRGTEYTLQKPTVFGKKFCFTKTDNFQEGPWTSQFHPLPPQDIRFDIWSRQKGSPLKL